MKARTAMVLGSLLAAAAVACGAFGAHGLEKYLVSAGYEANLNSRLEWFDTAVRYHMYHALGLVLVGLLAQATVSPRELRVATACFGVGLLLFCGCLYAMAIGPTTWKVLGAVVPFGGIALIAGWLVAGKLAFGSNPETT